MAEACQQCKYCRCVWNWCPRLTSTVVATPQRESPVTGCLHPERLPTGVIGLHSSFGVRIAAIIPNSSIRYKPCLLNKIGKSSKVGVLYICTSPSAQTWLVFLTATVIRGRIRNLARRCQHLPTQGHHQTPNTSCRCHHPY